MRCLLPLPVTVMASPWPGAGTPPRASPSASEMSQTCAVKQREHRGVAGEHPLFARLAGPRVGVGDLPGRDDGERFRQCFRHLRRSHGGQRADLALAVSLQKPGKRPDSRQSPHQRPPADAVAAPRRHEGAHVLRRQPGQFGESRLAAEMPGQKAQELPGVALVGLDGLGRHAALGAEMSEPARHLGGHVAGDECQFGIQLRVVLCLTRGRLSHRLPSPFLNRPESARSAAWPRRSSMSWCRSRSITPIRIGSRASLSSSPETSSPCRSARGRPSAWSGRRTSRSSPACTTG